MTEPVAIIGPSNIPDMSVAVLIAREMDRQGFHLLVTERPRAPAPTLYCGRNVPIPIPSLYGDRPVQQVKIKDKYAPKAALEAAERLNRQLNHG